jgi:hypothetical protein
MRQQMIIRSIRRAHYDVEKYLLGLLAIFLGALNTHVLGCWADSSDRTEYDQRLMSAWLAVAQVLSL